MHEHDDYKWCPEIRTKPLQPRAPEGNSLNLGTNQNVMKQYYFWILYILKSVNLNEIKEDAPWNDR